MRALPLHTELSWVRLRHRKHPKNSGGKFFAKWPLANSTKAKISSWGSLASGCFQAAALNTQEAQINLDFWSHLSPATVPAIRGRSWKKNCSVKQFQHRVMQVFVFSPEKSLGALGLVLGSLGRLPLNFNKRYDTSFSHFRYSGRYQNKLHKAITFPVFFLPFSGSLQGQDNPYQSHSQIFNISTASNQTRSLTTFITKILSWPKIKRC